MEETVFIYALRDPRDMEVRYIGWSSRPAKRLKNHISAARTGSETGHKARWNRKLISIGMLPCCEILEHTTPKEWQPAEMRWIAYYRRLGNRLTNSTDGGEGMLGWKPSVKTRAKMSAFHRQRWRDPKTLAKVYADAVARYAQKKLAE
jgi:hypothetical protein